MMLFPGFAFYSLNNGPPALIPGERKKFDVSCVAFHCGAVARHVDCLIVTSFGQLYVKCILLVHFLPTS